MATQSSSTISGSSSCSTSSSVGLGSSKLFRQEANYSNSNSEEDDQNYTRLWIGNLDPKLTEGYAFVTYKDTATAQKCMDALNGKRILEKTLVVRWAHQTTFTVPDEEEKLKRMLPALGMKSEPERGQNKEKTISAIEAKLRAMERDTLHFHLSSPTSGTSSSGQTRGPSTSYSAKPQNSNNNNFQNTATGFARLRSSKPYERNAQRRK